MTPEQAVADHSGLVHSVANKFRSYLRVSSSFDHDDLVQIGFVGLLKGARRFDPAKGFKPTTYLYTRIEGEILSFLRDNLAHVRMSRRHSLREKSRLGKVLSLHVPVDDERTDLSTLSPVLMTVNDSNELT